MTEVAANEFVCAGCGGVFTKAWSDEEMLAEANNLFTPTQLEDSALVCDPCWKIVMGIEE